MPNKDVAFREVLKRLPLLTVDQLKVVQVRSTLLSGGVVAPEVFEDNDWLLAGIVEELRRRGLWLHKYPIPAKLIPDAYRKASGAARVHLERGCSGTLRTAEKLALSKAAASALADYLIRAKVPVGPKTLLANVDKLPVALEAAFPGYWGIGMLSACLGKMNE